MVETLADYLAEFGNELAYKVETTFDPLHIPGRDPLPKMDFVRSPLPAQSHVVAASVKALHRTGSVWVTAKMGTGKAQPLSAMVLTPDGFVPMGLVKVGSRVVNPDGGLATVVGVFPQGEKDVYRVTFTDGSSTECCEEHLWAVRTPQQKFAGKPFQVRQLSELMKDYDFGSVNSSGKRNTRYFIPMSRAWEGNATVLPIDPYLLGVLLGDGSLVLSTPTLTSDYGEILPHIEAACSEIGVELRERAVKNNTQHVALVSVEESRDSRGCLLKSPLGMRLSQLGLLGVGSEEKFVPAEYLGALLEDRLALLQGLCDTDGTVEADGGVEFYSCSIRLAKAVVFLVQSLGGTAHVRGRAGVVYQDASGNRKRSRLTNFRVRIKLPNGVVPFRLERKVKRVRSAEKYQPRRGISKIEKVGRKECQCIALDSDNQLYVTDDFIVTHNTFMGAAIAHLEADGRDYRSIVMCPPHLIEKWKRELESTIPGVKARIIMKYNELVDLARCRPKPQGPEWLVISSSSAKLGNPWQASYLKDMSGFPVCPKCAAKIFDGQRTDDDGEGLPMPAAKLQARQRKCEECGESLFQWRRQYDRWPVATYIQRKMRGMFRHLVVDEMHQAKGAETAIAVSMSKLASVCPYFIGLTGTIMGGYATDMHGLLWRTSPSSLVHTGERYEERSTFAERYGRLERVITESRTGGSSNRMSMGSSKTSQSVRERPGVMPALFADHLLDKAVFLSLDEVAADLPNQDEQVVPAALDADVEGPYKEMEKAFQEHIRGMMMSKSGRQAMSTMVHMLMGYPDKPYGWGTIGYDDGDSWVHVCTPPDLDSDLMRPKERALVNGVIREIGQGRQVWVFLNMTQKYDLQPRLATLLRERGLRVQVMRSQQVPTKDRERWIARHGKHCDVIISHPGLVETGLELFDLKSGHNFSSLFWYQTGYSLFTLRQASARALRIGQTRECRVCYYYYTGTMQSRAMDLMCQKLVAAESVEGKFSEGGLASLSDDTESMTVALAKSLANSIDDAAGIRAWERLKSGGRTS